MRQGAERVNELQRVVVIGFDFADACWRVAFDLLTYVELQTITERDGYGL